MDHFKLDFDWPILYHQWYVERTTNVGDTNMVPTETGK